MSAIIKLNTFSVSNVAYSSVKTNAAGGKSVSVNYKNAGESSLLTFQTPRMLSFGINRWENEKAPSEAPRLSTTLSFGNMSDDAKVAEFHAVLKAIDEWAIDAATKNAWEWLKVKGATRDAIAMNYTPLVHTPVDKVSGEPNGKPDFVKFKLNKNDKGEFMTSFFNKEKERVPSCQVEEFFTMGSYVRALIQCSGFWIVGNKFGLTFRLNQIVVEPPVRIGKSYAFIDDEEESSPSPATKAVEKVTPAVPAASSTHIEDSDEEPNEDEDESSEERLPSPPKKATVVKKVVKRN